MMPIPEESRSFERFLWPGRIRIALLRDQSERNYWGSRKQN